MAVSPRFATEPLALSGLHGVDLVPQSGIAPVDAPTRVIDTLAAVELGSVVRGALPDRSRQLGISGLGPDLLPDLATDLPITTPDASPDLGLTLDLTSDPTCPR